MKMTRGATLIIAISAFLNALVAVTATPCTVTSPSCGLTVFIPPTDFQINLSDPVNPSSVQASDLTVNKIPADSANLSNNNTTIDFIFNTSPAVPGLNNIHISAGAFDCGPPVDFNCTFFLEPKPTPTPTATPSSTATPTPTPEPPPSCSPPCYLPVTWSESFDNVTPPALPPGWVATNAQGPPPLWVTSNSGVPIPPADTLPNAVFIDDPAVVSDKRLDSLTIPLPGAQGLLTFRHNFNLEASDVDPNLGFDGGVLEISFDNGNTFQDILDAGGSFVVGGYNRTISTDRGSPIAGRRAWSGNSGGFITTQVVVIINGFSGTKLRWRMASDMSGSNEGWRVDTVNFSGCAPVPCETPTPTPTPTPTRAPTPRPRPTPLHRPTAP
jgi:hypothetical protein